MGALLPTSLPGRGDACGELGSRTAGPESPCLPAKGSVAVGTGLHGDGERSGYCRSSAEER